MQVGAMVCSFYAIDGLYLTGERKEPTIEEAMKATSRSGLRGIELQDFGSGFDEKFPNAPSKGRLRKVKETAESLGLEIPVISAMAGSFLESNIDEQIAYVGKWLGLASSIDTKILKINLGTKPEGMSDGRAFEQAKTCIMKCVTLAEEYGIPLAPELWPLSFPSNDPFAMITLLKIVDSKYFRLTLDNEHLPSEWAVTCYKQLAPYGIHVHMSMWDEKRMRASNREKYAFEKFIPILKSVDYDGYLMIEWRGPNEPIAEAEEGLRKSNALLTRGL